MDGFIKSIDSFLKFNRLEKHIKFSWWPRSVAAPIPRIIPQIYIYIYVDIPSDNFSSGLQDRMLSLYTSLLTKSEGTKNKK
jgi:hypothetical protein